MRIVTKYETEDEMMVIVAIEKEPLKEPYLMDKIRIDDFSDEVLIELIKKG